ncbi:signal peptidase I [Virgibacillus sp. W0181]|uniref:signal peptidase I n=1 Tax=Virgibacillus sp. W0181 TaxID=3391581 RepID=UPI003F478734
MAMRKREWIDWLKALLIAFGIAFIIRMFIFSPIIVDGPSMLPTLHDHDQIIVNKFIYRFNEPERFDVVVFHASDEKDFIKRVIGLPGEHVMMKDNVLYINGEEIEEQFIEDNNIHTDDFTLELLPGQHESIPDGYVFVLGDNRNNSTDSRRESVGLVPIDQIVGKASLIYWPFDRIQLVKE